MSSPEGVVSGLPASADQKIFGAALRWWIDARERLGRLPSRADLSPEHVSARALRWTMLVDIAEGGDKLRFRLMGTAHVDFNRRDLTGVDFDDIYPSGSPVLIYVKGLYREMVAARRPLWSENDVAHPSFGNKLSLRRLMMPLSTNGETVDLCLAVQTITERPLHKEDPENPWHFSPSPSEQIRILL